MNAIAAAISRRTGKTLDGETLKPVLIFSAVGLAITAGAVLSYGLDLAPGLF